MGIRLEKENGSSAGGAPVRGGGRAGGAGAGRGRGTQGRDRKARRRGPVGRLHRVAPAGRDPSRGRARRNTCGGGGLGCSDVGPPLCARVRRTGRPRLPDEPQRAGASAPGVASAAAWAGARPSSTRRHWAGSARARARARGTGAALGRGKCTKPAFRRGATGSGEGQNASGRPNALKGQRDARASCLNALTPKVAGAGRSSPALSKH